MANCTLPLDNAEFYARYLPLLPDVSNHQKRSSSRTSTTLLKVFGALKNTRRGAWLEADIAQTFTRAINKHKVAGRLVLALSQLHKDADDPSQQKIDGAFFEADKVPTEGCTHWADQLVSVEFKSGKTENDPYDDRPKKPFESEAAERKKVRSQIINHAQLVLERQHRTHLFTLIIIGRCFRIVRWDRSGAVVTPLVDYVDNPEVLYDFLWRLSCVNKETLGLDPTATPVRKGSQEYNLMNRMAREVKSDLPAEHKTRLSAGSKGKVFKYVRTAFRESLDDEWPRWKLQVPHGKEMRTFLVGKPRFCAKGLVGRGTRGYIAIDYEEKRFVWLKDAWRTFYDLVEPEGTVLHQLNAAGVVNVPTLVSHGDLPGQFTKTPELWEDQHHVDSSSSTTSSSSSGMDVESTIPPRTATGDVPTPSPGNPMSPGWPSARRGTKRRLAEDREVPPPMTRTEPINGQGYDEGCPLRKHVHYRLVVEEVGCDLNTFENGEHLISVVHDCIIAHREAVMDANILHRDISGGNILIFPRIATDSSGRRVVLMQGLLTDWEFSKDISNARPRQACQPERTGTWQYMSAAIISDPKKAVEISDELESFFHVILYNAVRYIPSTCSNVPQYLAEYFDAYQVQDGRYRCSNKKYTTVTQGSLLVSEQGDELLFNSPIDDVLRYMLGWIKARYEILTYNTRQEQQARGPKVQPLPLNLPSPSNEQDVYDPIYDPLYCLRKCGSFMPSAINDKPAPPDIKPPSDATLKAAQRLAKHDAVASVIGLILANDLSAHLKTRWNPGDRGPDRKDLCPPEAHHRLRTAPTHLSKKATAKRPRVDSHVSAAPAAPATQGAPAIPCAPDEPLPGTPIDKESLPRSNEHVLPPKKRPSTRNSSYSVHRMTLRSSASQRTQDSGYATGSRSGPKSKRR